MQGQTHTLATFYNGWDKYQQHLVHALAPLTTEQLNVEASSNLRPAGMIARHMIGARARWLNYVLLKEKRAELWPLSKWDDADQPARSGEELAHGLKVTWQVLQDGLQRWTSADMEDILHDTDDDGNDETFTRQWVIWHLIEHDLHHGGELSFVLGMHGLPAIDL
ncbi:DinB family protein [Dictyobacter formicarum]|uniref:DinB-like domain-containing protein n=1 Tax=Dictyobacter formicarum TaxID=2778368 RepID=A0ABQ3VJA5_9CHLR|nr:DinB family protein [Dictyobacter formicarum]GHO85759.1 hypothetical protein KSZ_37650 [Dictyobacter formicarum]